VLALGQLREANFDPHLHGLLCEELKHLYVALTRARKTVGACARMCGVCMKAYV